jgi:hypothetical protein
MSNQSREASEYVNRKPTREQIAYVIQAKKQGFAIPLDLALEMADSILWLWEHPGEPIPADVLS